MREGDFSEPEVLYQIGVPPKSRDVVSGPLM
jgi:hypothetical protein